MHKAAYMAILFTFGLWTGGIFAPTPTPAVDEIELAADRPAPAAEHQEASDRVQP